MSIGEILLTTGCRFVASTLLLVSALYASDGPLAPQYGLLDEATSLTAVPRPDSGLMAVEPFVAESITPLDYRDARIILLRVNASEASALRLHFENFHLPVGCSLYVYGIDERSLVTESYGPFVAGGPTNDGNFWSHPIRGTVYIELQMSRMELVDLPFNVAEVERTKAAPSDSNSAARAFEGIRTGNYRGETITFAVRDGDAVFEDDIELGLAALIPEPDSGKGTGRHQSTIINSISARWPNGTIPYAIDPTLPDQSRITGAISHWNSVLSGTVRLVARTGEANYVQFTNTSDAGRCSSYVGLQNAGPQSIWIGSYCSTGNVIHEIGHAFGLWHEQTRNDRDSHVKIHWENIQSSMSYNFQTTGTSGVDSGAYDFNSIMHYPAYAFSSNGGVTIETIPAGISIGQRSVLSSGDIAGIRALYPGTSTPAPTTAAVTVTTNPLGIGLTVDGTAISTAVTNNWVVGSTHTIAAPTSVIATGTRATLIAWSDQGSATHTITVPATATVLSADYARSYQVAATVKAGNGTVALSPTATDGYYAENSTVSVTATPADGSCFASWTGLIAGTPATASFAVTKPFALAATFQGGSYRLPQSFENYSKLGGSGALVVQTASGCAWSVRSLNDWITVPSARLFGTGGVSFSVAPNRSGTPRIGRIQAAGLTYTIVQYGN